MRRERIMGGIPKRRGRGCGKGRGELSADRAILHGEGGETRAPHGLNLLHQMRGDDQRSATLVVVVRTLCEHCVDTRSSVAKERCRCWTVFPSFPDQRRSRRRRPGIRPCRPVYKYRGRETGYPTCFLQEVEHVSSGSSVYRR